MSSSRHPTSTGHDLRWTREVSRVPASSSCSAERSARTPPPDQPRITVRPDLVEELGGVSNVLFPIEAPHVQTHATRAAIEASDDDATLPADDPRARFCAAIAGRRVIRPGEDLELAVDHRHLHFFDPDTADAIGV